MNFFLNEASILIFAEVAKVKGMTPDICYLVFPHPKSCTPKLWYTYVVMYGDFMVIVKPCFAFFYCKSNFLVIYNPQSQ